MFSLLTGPAVEYNAQAMSDLDRVKQLFLQALEVPESERAFLLDKECAGDSKLLSEVEKGMDSD